MQVTRRNFLASSALSGVALAFGRTTPRGSWTTWRQAAHDSTIYAECDGRHIRQVADLNGRIVDRPLFGFAPRQLHLVNANWKRGESIKCTFRVDHSGGRIAVLDCDDLFGEPLTYQLFKTDRFYGISFREVDSRLKRTEPSTFQWGETM